MNLARYGYITGRFKDQLLIQYDVLIDCGLEFDGGIFMDEPWGEFLSRLQEDDEVVVVAESRIALRPDERQARKEMLELLGVRLHALTREFEKDGI